jgi:urocanate hydratase
MIDNNLDFEVALYPYELVTYGETGSVCHDWMQYVMIKRYLQILTDHQTLAMESGHPLGLFPSEPNQPRVIITNGLMVGMYDNLDDWEIAEEMGVANYGQMTAGGWMYIGPQGIVHGTFNTLLNAGRQFLGVPENDDLSGKLFVSSGMGGMSGAQPKAIKLAGGVGIIAEVDASRIQTRLSQGWVDEVVDDLPKAFDIADEARRNGEAVSIAYAGNVVDLLQYAVDHDVRIDLLSDQTSCHAVYEGGYCPAWHHLRRTYTAARRGPGALSGSSSTNRSSGTSIWSRSCTSAARTSSITATPSSSPASTPARRSFRATAWMTRTASRCPATWKTSWARTCSTTATAPSAGCA